MAPPKTSTAPRPYNPPRQLVEWLDAEKGRNAYFKRVDPGLFPPMITKMKQGLLPITFEHAVRIERAQKPSATPLRAIDLMTFVEHRELYLYVTGQKPAPVPAPKPARRSGRPGSTSQPRTIACT